MKTKGLVLLAFIAAGKSLIETRPDTWHQRRGRLGRGSNAKTARNSEMLRTDGQTDQHGKV